MKNSYIHFTKLNLETIESIFKYGIMSKYNLRKNKIYNRAGTGNNGKYYISLTKRTSYNNGIFYLLSHNTNCLGIELISDSAIKAVKNDNWLFTNTPLRIRTSTYNDEWQTKETLTKDKFVALHYPLNILEKECHNEKELNDIKNILEEIKNLMKIYDIDIPLITNEKVYTK